MAVRVESPLVLPNGAVIPNRLAKASMEENMAAHGQLPGEAIYGLYQAWAQGGAGLILTGNVMIDARALTGPGGIVLEARTPLEPFKRWAQVAKSGGAQVWMQINHPGRQVQASMGGLAWAPSAVSLQLGPHSHRFVTPKAMSEADIEETIRRFGDSAAQAELAGFHGVEIHAAHGYLLSQFLSPLTNRREDGWGGSASKRARLLLEVVKEIRRRVLPGFVVAVKLNSADFQRGGFEATDAREVVGWLNELAVDLVELSGGSYESPAMQGQAADGRSMAREAYFLEFATSIAAVARMPVMTTGGIVRRTVAEQVLAQGVAVVGMATALAIAPDLPRRWIAGEDTVATVQQVDWTDKLKASLARMSLIKRRLRALGAGQRPAASYSPLLSLVLDQLRLRRLTRRYGKWLAGQPF